MNLIIEGDNTTELSNPSSTAKPKLPGKSALNWDEPPSLMLDERGMIQDCSKSIENLFGYMLGELVWQHISCLFPEFSDVELIHKGEIKPTINYISRCGHIFLGLDRRGNIVPNELNFIRLEHHGMCRLRLILRPRTECSFVDRKVDIS